MYIYIYTLWLFNIALGNGPFLDGLTIKNGDVPWQTVIYMGVSENSVPVNPMVLLIIIPMKNGYFIGNINPTFSDKPISYSHHSNGKSTFPMGKSTIHGHFPLLC